MARSFLKNFKSPVQAEINTGFGSNSSNYGGRFLHKSGKSNVHKTGLPFLETISWFHTLLNIPRWKFMLIILVFYFLVNMIFASLYWMIGVEHLKGISPANTLEAFGQAFFFSIQTFTTVGYGHISPSGFWTSLVAAIEALFGLLSFAIATGLFYGRFSKPRAYVLFSENAVIAPFEGGKALMLRLSPYKNTHLTDAEVKVTLSLHIEENGQKVNRFYSLDLEYSKINSLPLSWTLVHKITAESPLYSFTGQDYQNIGGEILIFFKVFDDMYSTTVVRRTSYLFSEVVYGARFLPMFTRDIANSKTILHLDKLNAMEKVKLD